MVQVLTFRHAPLILSIADSAKVSTTLGPFAILAHSDSNEAYVGTIYSDPAPISTSSTWYSSSYPSSSGLPLEGSHSLLTNLSVHANEPRVYSVGFSRVKETKTI